MTKKQKVLKTMKMTKPAALPAPTATDQFSAIKDKFKQLSEVRAKINASKALYQQHDALLSELLPLFITKTDTQFIIQREITLGNEKHTLVPYFYDAKKGAFLAKQWKSTAMETATIE